LDQPLFSQDMIERWMASSLYPKHDNIEVGDQKQNEFDDECKQTNC
jgi:hypothetical protein